MLIRGNRVPLRAFVWLFTRVCFLNVSSDRLPERRHICTGWFFSFLLHCVFSLCSVSLLMHVWVQVEHSLLCRQIYTWISCNSSRLHAGCVWTYGDELNGAPKKLILNIFDDLVSKIFGKYLHIQLSKFCWPQRKKIILGCFFSPR